MALKVPATVSITALAMRLWGPLSLGLIALVAFCPRPAAASANVRGCHYTYGDGPRNDRDVPLDGVSVRNMACSAGLRAISNGRLLGSGAIATSGFRCYTLKRFILPGTANELSGAVVWCASGPRAFR